MKNGIHRISREEYDKIPRANFSKLKWLQRSPAHYHHQLLHGSEDTDALKFGRGLHLAVFEPELFLSECVEWDGGRRYGKEWDKFCAAHKDQTILTTGEYEQCRAIANSVRNHHVAAKYLSGGKAEQTVLWTHEEPAFGGVEGFKIDCKSRLDFIAHVGAVVDLKTTIDASPRAFESASWKYRYHVQGAFYVNAVKSITGVELPYVIAAVEKSEPYVTQVYHVPEAILERGRQEYRRLLSLLHQCRSENKWDGYSDGELELTLPRWAFDDAGEDEDLTGMGLVFGEQQAG